MVHIEPTSVQVRQVCRIHKRHAPDIKLEHIKTLVIQIPVESGWSAHSFWDNVGLLDSPQTIAPSDILLLPPSKSKSQIEK